MARATQPKHVFSLLLLMISICLAAFSAHSSLKGGAWQVLPTSTGEIEGTRPQADSAVIPVYQGSIQLDPTQTYSVPYTATPGNFSVDAAAGNLILNNPRDAEGDLFSTPPRLAWVNQQVPDTTLIWADASTPETPLNPQPINNKTFCAQHLAGRHLVAWSKIIQPEPAPLLQLSTLTGTPDVGEIPLIQMPVAINIAPAESEPLTVSASSFNSTLNAAKVKVGESITLTVSTHDCSGKSLGNIPFVITRMEAKNRQGKVNDAAPVTVGNTELNTPDTAYHGVTNASGEATVTVTQDDGPGVKTTLRVKPEGVDALENDIDLIFTTLTSPDNDKAAMWGHMAESATVDGFTFTRPKLAAEATDADATALDHNETWAQFNWSNADNHCHSLLPDIRRLGALVLAQRGQTIQETLGWPLQGNYYWSSSVGAAGQHHAVDMRNKDADSFSDANRYLVSCVDKSIPVVTPKITLTLDNFDTTLNAAKARVGDTLVMKVDITDSETGEPLPYYYFTLKPGTAHNRQNETDAAWDATPVILSGEHIQASEAHGYQGMTDANGEATVFLTQPQGAGVRTTLNAGMRDGYTTSDQKDVIFTVLTSPDSDKARMWGHMKKGVAVGSDMFTRPLLAAESDDKTDAFRENYEDWATFSLLTKGENACGDGGVPSLSSFDRLYAAHPGNQIENDLGWPTGGHRYLASDNDGVTYHNVSLETGEEGAFTSGTENYLTCSATGLAADLQVLTNGDATQRQAKAKVGENVTLTVKTVNSLNGEPAPNVAFTVTTGIGLSRQGLATGFTPGGALVINGQSMGVSSAYTGTYQGVTDDQGLAQLIIEQPKGTGVKTPVTIQLVNSRVASPINYEVIFSVITSPDSEMANMWGHMDDSVAVGNDTFERPKLKAEFSTPPTSYNVSVNETWGRLDYPAISTTEVGGCKANHLPTSYQLSALYNANPDNNMNTVHGWPVPYSYWTSTLVAADKWNVISLTSGTLSSGSSASTYYVSCLKNANPVATKVKLEVVDSAQWDDSLKAAKVKKGETLQLKVTATDDAGNPVAGIPLTLSRSSDIRRSGSTDSSVMPMIINGQALSDTTAFMSITSGADGSAMLDVSRPDTRGTKAAIVAKLSNNTAVSASIDTIFTVVTSPDSIRAQFWGHMPETLTGADGSVFKRPILWDERTSYGLSDYRSENNETWGLYTWAVATSKNTGCTSAGGTGYIPTQSDLESLYSAHSGGTITSADGWPSGETYWSSTPDTSQTTSRYYKVTHLDTGTSTSKTETGKVMLTCLTSPHAVATQLELSSPSYVAERDAAIGKKEDNVIFVVKTKDAQGNPAPNAAFTITRGAGFDRSGSSATETYSTTVVKSASGPEVSLTTKTIKYFGMTDEQGEAQIEVTQPKSTGLKTVMTATLESNTAIAKSMDMIISVITSPDTDKAKYWGHMSDTVTTQSGKVFHRPLLKAEIPGVSNSYTSAGEIWAFPNWTEFMALNVEGCRANSQPSLSDLQELYSEHPNSEMLNVYGWPVVKYPWAADPTPKSDHSALVYQYISFTSGSVYSTSVATGYNGMMCLVEPKSVMQPASITVTSAAYDPALQAARAKKGESIPFTVTVNDSAGNPLPNALFILSRNNSLKRSGQEYTATASTMQLVALTPSTYSRQLGSTSIWYGKTEADGSALFTINQDNTVGLKTLITAKSVNDVTIQATMDTIFTVLTSPDSDKAVYWGHMPETFTAANGAEFRRPLLYDEFPEAAHAGSFTENNEKWPVSTFTELDSGACSRDQMPKIDDIESLYDKHPATSFGVPTSKPWWAGEKIPSNPADTKTMKFVYVNLTTNMKTATTSTTAAYMQPCLAHPRGLQFTVTPEPAKWDAEKSAAVARTGRDDNIPVTVAVTDASGKPVSDIMVSVTRGDSMSRQNEVVANTSISIVETSPSQMSRSLSSGDYYNVTTGSDGKAVFALSEVPGYGVKTPIIFSIDTLQDSKTLDTIFTSPNSPDSPYASSWGAMAETLEVNGRRYQRPRLLKEIVVPAGKTAASTTLSEEEWARFALPTNTTYINLQDACGSSDTADFPQLADLKAMYDQKLIGSGSAAGWPYSKTGDISGRYLAWDPDTGGYKVVDMAFGAITTAGTSVPGNMMLVTCPAK